MITRQTVGIVFAVIAFVLGYVAMFIDDKYFTPSAIFAGLSAWLIYG